MKFLNKGFVRWDGQSRGRSLEAAVPGRKIYIEVLHLVVATDSYCTEAMQYGVKMVSVVYAGSINKIIVFKMGKAQT